MTPTIHKEMSWTFSDESLTPEAEKMLNEVFDLYSTDGKMGRDQCKSFCQITISMSMKTIDSKVANFF